MGRGCENPKSASTSFSPGSVGTTCQNVTPGSVRTRPQIPIGCRFGEFRLPSEVTRAAKLGVKCAKNSQSNRNQPRPQHAHQAAGHREWQPDIVRGKESFLNTAFLSPVCDSLATQHAHQAAGHREWHLEGRRRGPHVRPTHASSRPLRRRVHLDGQRQWIVGEAPQGCTAGCKRVCSRALMAAVRKGVGRQEPYRWPALASCRWPNADLCHTGAPPSRPRREYPRPHRAAGAGRGA